MTDFDDRLRASLSREDEAFLRDLEQGRGMFTQFTATLHGPMALWTWIAGVFMLVFTATGFYAIWMLFHTAQTRALILWLMAALFSLNAVAMMKMWMFNRMNTLSVLREIKKLELRLAQLAGDS